MIEVSLVSGLMLRMAAAVAAVGRGLGSTIARGVVSKARKLFWRSRTVFLRSVRKPKTSDARMGVLGSTAFGVVFCAAEIVSASTVRSGAVALTSTSIEDMTG